jgi:hypothetical protein
LCSGDGDASLIARRGRPCHQQQHEGDDQQDNGDSYEHGESTWSWYYRRLLEI